MLVHEWWPDNSRQKSLTLAQGLEVSVPENVREIVRAVKEMTEAATRPGGMAWEGSSTVSQRVLADHLGRDISVISRNVRKAI